MTDTKLLRSLALAATPGPWSVPDGNRLLGAVSAKIDGMERQVASACGQAPQFEDVEDCGKRMAANAAYIAAASPDVVIGLIDEIEELRARLAGAEAANAATTATLVEHSELSGHMDIVEQCRDHFVHEVSHGNDTSGKLQDFVDSLRIVTDQLDRQRRSRNWYEVAYTAGKQKLIESAIDRVCCKGEPHTCDQEAVAAAEGRTDRLIEQLAAMRAARDEACDLAVEWMSDGWRDDPASGNRLAALRKVGSP